MDMAITPGPPRVQIQTQSGCNGRCIFCPNEEILRAKLPQGRMAPELYHKIINELAELEPRRISPYLMNEPLLDQRLPEFIRYTREKVPGATTLVTTNGTLLRADKAEALIDSGLARIKVSLQSLDPKRNAELMGYQQSSEEVIENVVGLKRLIEKKKSKLDLRVSMIVTSTNQDEIAAARRFWKKKGVRLVTSALENRGGNFGNARELNPHEMVCRSGACIRPFREMCILFNGDVVLCCVDWHRTVVVGNVAQESIRDVWRGGRIEEVREAMRHEREDGLPPICINCTESASPGAHRRSLGQLVKGLFGK